MNNPTEKREMSYKEASGEHLIVGMFFSFMGIYSIYEFGMSIGGALVVVLGFFSVLRSFEIAVKKKDVRTYKTDKRIHWIMVILSIFYFFYPLRQPVSEMITRPLVVIFIAGICVFIALRINTRRGRS